MSRTVADPADLKDPAKYTRLPRAEVFPEHVRYKMGADGKFTKEVVARFDKAWLSRYAAGCRQREAAGAPCAMTIGHTIDGAPESAQPEIVGYWLGHSVEWSPARKCWVMMADPLVQKGREEEAKSYPRASIEAWKHMPVIDPIAILRRTPDQATQWTYQAQTHGDRWRFSMEDPDMGPLDPTAAPDAMAPDQEFQNKFSACMASMYPHMQEMHQKYAAECGGQQEPMMDTPSATPATSPATPAAGADAMRFSALEQENKALKDRFSALEQKNAALEKQLRDKDRRAELEKLALRFHMDVVEELAATDGLAADKFAAHLQKIEKRYVPLTVDPAAGPFVDVTGSVNGSPQRFGAGEQGRDAPMRENGESARAFEHQRKHHERLCREYPDPIDRADAAMRFVKTGKEKP